MWVNTSEAGVFTGAQSAAYRTFFKRISGRHNFYFAYNLSAYQGGGGFRVAARAVGSDILPVDAVVAADVIYHHKIIAPLEFDPGPARIVNTPEFKYFCNSKIATTQYLTKYFPKTILATTPQEIRQAFEKIETSLVAVKPNFGSNGRGVIIAEKETIDPTKIRGEHIVQEFIDTSNGIPGICETYHDLRITTLNDTPVLCRVRTPMEGSLVSNANKGAPVFEVELNELPKAILDFYKEVHGEVKLKYPKPMYSMDMGMTPAGPYLIELNSHTAFPKEHYACKDVFIDNLIAHLENG